jgi:hypothetical protein
VGDRVIWISVRWRGDVGEEGCADSGDENGESEEVFIACVCR